MFQLNMCTNEAAPCHLLLMSCINDIGVFVAMKDSPCVLTVSVNLNSSSVTLSCVEL